MKFQLEVMGNRQGNIKLRNQKPRGLKQILKSCKHHIQDQRKGLQESLSQIREIVKKLEQYRKNVKVINKARLTSIHDLEGKIVSLSCEGEENSSMKAVLKDKDVEIHALKTSKKISNNEPV